MSLIDPGFEQRIDAQTNAIASAAGSLNLANAQLVATMADVLAEDGWTGPGIRSAPQWLSYKAGITTTRAKTIIDVADKRASFPHVIGRFDQGELSLEQVYELVQAPAWADADIEHWGTQATPARIRKSIKLNFGPDDHNNDDHADGHDAGDEASNDASTGNNGGEHDWLATGVTDDHRWKIRGEFDLADGTSIDHALLAAREALWARGQRQISHADCLRELAQRYLDGITSPIQRDRSKVWLHLDAQSGVSTTSLGVRIPDSVRDRICCDGLIQPVWEHDGFPVNVGRTQRIVPERTRRIVILRDQGCGVPGCNQDHIIEIHHIVHWLDDGVTETWNLIAVCPMHHRQHHNGQLGITGNADEPNGLTFTDANGRPLPGVGTPQPPDGDLPQPPNGYQPPLMERVDWDWVGLGWIKPTEQPNRPHRGDPPVDTEPPNDGDPPVDTEPPNDGDPPVDSEPPGDPPGDSDPPDPPTDGDPPEPPGDGCPPVNGDPPGTGRPHQTGGDRPNDSTDPGRPDDAGQ